MYHSLAVLSARFTVNPDALSALLADSQEVGTLPVLYVEPLSNHHSKYKDVLLSLSKAPVVSPANVIVFFSQVSAELTGVNSFLLHFL